MDPSTAVNTSAAISLIGFAVLIFLLLFLIAKWKWHVFFALLIPILLFGILPGIQQNNFIGKVENNKGCNVMVINQNIHCTGTHTECASHILNQDIYIHDVLSTTFIQTKLISITPEKWTETDESYHCLWIIMIG